MRNKLIISLLLISVLGAFVGAEEGIDITIANNTLTIEGYSKNADFGKFPAGFIESIDEALNPSLDCEVMNLTVVNETNSSHTYPLGFETNCLPVLDYTKEIKFDFNSSEMNQDYCLSDTDLLKDYIECQEEKSTYKIGYTTCTSDTFDKVGLDANLTKCNTDLQVCKSERTSAQNEKKRIEDETADTRNQKWTFGIGGLIVGVIGTLWYCGRIGGPKHKDPKDSYNQSQAA